MRFCLLWFLDREIVIYWVVFSSLKGISLLFCCQCHSCYQLVSIAINKTVQNPQTATTIAVTYRCLSKPFTLSLPFSHLKSNRFDGYIMFSVHVKIVLHNMLKNGRMFCSGFWKKSVCFGSSDGSPWILNGLLIGLFNNLLIFLVMKAGW